MEDLMELFAEIFSYPPVWIAALITIFTAPRLLKNIHQSFKASVLQLVKQAQADLSFETDFPIKVGADMRAALCYSLTPEQARSIASCEYPQKKQFSYKILRFQEKGNQALAVISVSIVYEDQASGLHLNFQDVRLSVHCQGEPGKGWHVQAVEHS
ncbi:MAG: hypothetical protein E7329_09995 [Clostridiales bacterium]|nr:hypothetical protein [Clostridiales bacterium]